MCGIAGKLAMGDGAPPPLELLTAMLGLLQHRGPDQFGVYLSERVGLACARLSIIDLVGGQQPIHNEDGSVWVVCNGEIFNYLELRATLEQRGHEFCTRSDTEVIVHLYEDRGPDFVQELNGQFAIALWDERREELLLVRDRLGVRPLYYRLAEGYLWFASECKALTADPSVSMSLDGQALIQTLTFWTTLSPRSIFRGVLSVPPGSLLRVRSGMVSTEEYWSLSFDEEESWGSIDDAATELRALLTDSIDLRLRADVPVGVYLSGGLDSSTVAALASRRASRGLRTFGIGFTDPAYDESSYQAIIRDFLGTDHTQTLCTLNSIAEALPEVVWHAEMPLLRTSPAPMFMLSALVRQEGYKVVLTGEGADEILGGYDVFREAAIRRFWARAPQSPLRPRLLRRLYPYIGGLAASQDAWLQAYFGQHLSELDDPFYAHRLRWQSTARGLRFVAAGLREGLAAYDPLAELADGLPAEFRRWKPLAQAQYLEMAIFLSEYLLSSQGDRMTMAHSVEGRYPFLDHRVVEFCGRLPAHYKLCALHEKRVLKRAAADLLPPGILGRAKQPYRAPIQSSLRATVTSADLAECVGPRALRDAGLFEPEVVQRLLSRCAAGGHLGETDEMALIAIVSTQLLHGLFVSRPRRVPAVPLEHIYVVERRSGETMAETGDRGHTASSIGR